MKATRKSKILTLLIIEGFYHWNFSSQQLFFDKITLQIAKSLQKYYDWAEGTLALILMAGCSYDCVKPKTSTTTFAVTR